MRERHKDEITTVFQLGGPLDAEHAKELEPDDRDGVLMGVEEILRHYRSDAYVLEAYGNLREARLIHEICSDVTHALADFLCVRRRGGGDAADKAVARLAPEALPAVGEVGARVGGGGDGASLPRDRARVDSLPSFGGRAGE